MALRPALRLVLSELLAKSATTRALSLDDVAEAIGTVAASADDVEALFAALETEGRTITDTDERYSPKADLVTVLAAARALASETGGKPSSSAIADRTGLAIARVRAALRFATIMAR